MCNTPFSPTKTFVNLVACSVRLETYEQASKNAVQDKSSDDGGTFGNEEMDRLWSISATNEEFLNEKCKEALELSLEDQLRPLKEEIESINKGKELEEYEQYSSNNLYCWRAMRKVTDLDAYGILGGTRMYMMPVAMSAAEPRGAYAGQL